jgi:acid phosphatase type 7
MLMGFVRKSIWVWIVAAGCALAGVLLAQAGKPQDASGRGGGVEPGDAVLVGAGDIASCDDLKGAEATAKLIEKISGTVFAAGDLAYPDGSEADFANCYEPTWGRFRERTRPAPGNHEYHQREASAYARCFGAAAGDPAKESYSYALGAWHIVVLNSECAEVGGCDTNSAQGRWLRQDLAQHSQGCKLAYFHEPLFSSGGKHGNNPLVRPLCEMLYAAGADVVINGHDHDYERFAPQDPQGHLDESRGIREFVVGTGGKNSHRRLGAVQPNSEIRNDDTYGVLKLTLHSRGYDWEFVPEAGKTFRDSGSGSCR